MSFITAKCFGAFGLTAAAVSSLASVDISGLDSGYNNQEAADSPKGASAAEDATLL